MREGGKNECGMRETIQGRRENEREGGARGG